VHLCHKYVGTCNGVVLVAPERFDGGGASIVLFNPAIAGSEEAVRMELPDLPEPGRYRVSGFGYGTSRRLHMVLVAREEECLDTNDRKSRRAMYRAKELLVYTLGAGGPSSPDDRQRRSVLPELDAKISSKSVYLDGKVYLLADYSRVLVFDVDDETVATVDLPGERLPGKRRRHARSKLMEVSGRLCVATATDDKLSLWLLTPDQQWVRLCESRCGDVNAAKLAGAWDCGGVLLLYFMWGRSSRVRWRSKEAGSRSSFCAAATGRRSCRRGASPAARRRAGDARAACPRHRTRSSSGTWMRGGSGRWRWCAS